MYSEKIRNYESEVGQPFRYAIHYLLHQYNAGTAVVGYGGLFVMTANNLSVYVRENINFSVLLNDDMKEAEAIRFQKQLEEEPFVKQATYISKAQALKEQTEAMGTDPAEFLGYNPFTASIEIKLNAAYANSDSLSWIQENCWTIKSH